MADNENKIVSVFEAKVDKSSFNQAQVELKRQAEKQQEVTNALKKSADIAVKLGDTQVKANRQATKEIEKLTQAAKERKKVEADVLKTLIEQEDALRNRFGSIGNVDSASNAVRGGFQTLGVNIPILEQVAGLAELGEGVIQLKGSIQPAKQAVLELADGIGKPGVGMVGAIAGGVIALKVIEAQLNDLFKAGNDLILANNQAILDVNRQVTQGSTYDELFQRRNELQQSATDTADAIARINDQFKILREGSPVDFVVATLSGTIGNLSGQRAELETQLANELAQVKQLNIALSDESTARNDATRAALDNIRVLRENYQLEQQVTAFAKSATQEQLNDRLAQLQSESDLIRAQQAELQPFLTQNTAQSEQARQEFDLLAKQLARVESETALLNGRYGEQIKQREADTVALEKQKEAEKEREKSLREQATALSRLVALENQATSAIESFQQKQSELAEDRGIRDLDAQTDFDIKRELEQTKHNQELQKISQEGNKRIEQARQAVTDLEADYMQGQIELHQQFINEEKKLNRRRNLDELRAREDHLDNLLNAQQNNDVLAFLSTERDFQKQERRRKEDVDLENKERRDQLNQELADNRNAFLERRALLKQEADQLQTQLNERIQAERNAFEQQQNLAQQAFDREQARIQRNDQLADQRSQQALQRTLNSISQRANAELQGISAVIGASNQLVGIAQRISALALSGGASSASSSSSRIAQYQATTRLIGQRISATTSGLNNELRVLSNRAVPTAFGNEGYVTKPTLSVLGEKLKRGEAEAAIKFRLSEGLPASILRRAGGIGGNTQQQPIIVNLTMNNSVGDIATVGMIETWGQDVVNQIESQLVSAISTARNNPAV